MAKNNRKITTPQSLNAYIKCSARKKAHTSVGQPAGYVYKVNPERERPGLFYTPAWKQTKQSSEGKGHTLKLLVAARGSPHSLIAPMVRPLTR